MTVAEPRPAVGKDLVVPGNDRRRRAALVVAVLLTVLAVIQLVAFALGLAHSGPLPTRRGSPIPLLLVAAPAWAMARPWPPPPARLGAATARVGRVPPWLLVTLALVVAVALWYALQDHLPFLGHDEAVYATKARSWLTDSPAAAWALYRPVGMPALGWAALAVRNTAGALRLVGLVLALMTLVITYVVAARLTTPRRAVVALLLVLSGWAFLRRLPEFLDDIGAAGLLLLVAYLTVRSRQRPESYVLPAAAGAVAVAAFYLRYGAVSGLFVLAVSALVTWGWRVWANSWRQVATAVAVMLGGLVPHLLYSTRAAGSPLAILLSAERSARSGHPGEGLVYYALIYPFRLTSDLGGVVMACAVVAAALAAVRLFRGRPEHPADRVWVYFGLAGVLQPIVLGVTAHGEERYVFLSVLLLTIVGVDGLAEFAGQWSAVVLAAVASLAVLIGAANYRVVADGDLATVTAERTSLAAVGLRLAAGAEPCLIETSYQPELAWYSGCATTALTGRRWLQPSPDRVVHIVLFRRGSAQPSVAEVRALLRNRPAEIAEVRTTGSLGNATIITLPARAAAPR